jgi:pyruvate dehydrogenase E2 component (dihydrolipoamide acetyltransferase)
MPKQGQSVETCIITKWFKSPGENVRTGDLLLSYETDKAAFDLESPADGILLGVFFNEGSEVPVLINVAVIGQAGESVSDLTPAYTEKNTINQDHPEKNESEKMSPEVLPVSGVSIPASGTKISPRAKKLAESKNFNYNNIHGSGPNGRIIMKDIELAISAGACSDRGATAQGDEEYSENQLSNVRKLIAKAMCTSLQSTAQLTHHMSADVRKLLMARQKIKSEIASGKACPDITLNDMVCWCVIRALEKFPEANSHLIGETIRTFRNVHLGIAVDTTRGLMVPAVRNANKMKLDQLSAELRFEADACRKGNINPELIQSTSATFTVSNLGNYGVEIFTPVINLPQAAILGVCTITYRPADLGDRIFGFVPYIGLSLTYDHRAIDGGPATLFLKEIREQIESFSY